MKITLFTSNKNRHNYLINLLSEVCDQLFVVQECGTIMTVPDNYYDVYWNYYTSIYRKI